MATLIDSNVIVSLLIQSEKTEDAEKILENVRNPVTIITVIEESIYIGLSLIYDARGTRLKNKIKDCLRDDAVSFLRNLESFLEDFEIKLIAPPNDVKLLTEIIEKYSLLPNDALIVATCKFYGIKHIASFDKDFQRVDFLEVVVV